MTSPLSVRTITPDQHLGFVRAQDSVSFLQVPAWGEVKSDWRRESVGWFRGEEVVGAGLVLYRQVPRLKRYLAYLPEGPVIDWEAEDLAVWLDPMVSHLKGQGAFGIRMGPPVVTRRWDAASIKAGVADESVRTLDQVPPLTREPAGARVVSALRTLGWREQKAEGGFAAGQPQYNFQVPLAGKDEDAVLAGMNQQWRRNIKKAAKEGVVAGRVPADQLAPRLEEFHDLYVHTAERDHFTPRPLSYFQTMFRALGAEDPDRIALFTAEHEGDLVAATILVQVGTHVWYSYGASSTDKREVRGSNAAQWAMIRHALATGATVYDLRGITDTLDEDDSHVGLIRFKVGTGGEAVEHAGEWDLPVNRALYKAFTLYLARRG
ncbi:lipid II:glycine glycyltransferase FemX [Nocardioides marmoribigeumensis]|uniref:Vancomycin resistance protein VanK n=1 Tax=Nocardioides marmoribigeumensis TaxID=433649 RepID=A0ABU2BUJ9_9ACTN|nr:peptidoglycan bridge formation glycyltransferase FemA/FemB family protein [Nocardioides marmoribigeumensis]MDR7362303.1 vancomycin resistance protein VanK [Nocardioides marmoribigeumensis]